MLVVTKDSFANTLSQYDDFRAGALFDPAKLQPFDFTVNDFDVTFIREGRERGMAHEFAANLTYHDSPTAPAQQKQISVNHPLDIDGTDVFLLGHGYAPHITVRNADGSVAYSGAVPFLPEDSTLPLLRRGQGARRRAGRRATPADRAGGRVLPDVRLHRLDRSPFSAFPDDKNPAISMLAYSGDLGLDSGVPQSVYSLDKKGLTQLKTADGQAGAARPRGRRHRRSCRTGWARSASTASAAT